MGNRTVVGVVIVIIIILILIFVWWRPFSPGVQEDDLDGGDVSGEVFTGEINASHYFVDGVHTIEGNITLPTPCHDLNHEVFVAESMPEQVHLKFTSENTTEICTQVISDKFFTVSFQASKEALISATLNGNPVTLNLAEGGEGNVK